MRHDCVEKNTIKPHLKFEWKFHKYLDFFFFLMTFTPDGTVLKNLSAIAGISGDMDSVLRSGRSHGVGNGNLLQYSCLENPMDRIAWLATVQRVTKSQTQLHSFHMLAR